MLSLRLLSLTALAAAGPIRTAQEYAQSFKNITFDAVTDGDVDNFAWYAQHCSASYCNSEGVEAGAAISCGGNCDDLEANGVTILSTFAGDDTGIAGYLAVDEVRSEIVLAVRGSSNIKNWISNFEFNFVDSSLTTGAEVHDGFNSAWGEMSEGVATTLAAALETYPGFKIVATGHSLGGAVAMLGGGYLRNDGYTVDIYTFGAPRIGNGVVSDYISAQDGPEFRITHLDDPVPRLPPIIFGYRHTSPEYWLSKSESTGEDYPIEEIEVCEGNRNVDCNAGTFGLNVGAHALYFGPISECSNDASAAAAALKAAEDDADLEERLNGWVQEDIDYVNGGGN